MRSLSHERLCKRWGIVDLAITGAVEKRIILLLNLMRKEDFKVGVIFRTSTGEWLVTQVDNLKVMAKPLWRWASIKEDADIGYDREHFPKNFPAISFSKKHWPACITIEEWKMDKIDEVSYL